MNGTLQLLVVLLLLQKGSGDRAGSVSSPLPYFLREFINVFSSGRPQL